MKRALILLTLVVSGAVSAQKAVPAYPLVQNVPGQPVPELRYGQFPPSLVCAGNDQFMDNRDARRNCEMMENYRRLGYGIPGYSKDLNAVHAEVALLAIEKVNPEMAQQFRDLQFERREKHLNDIKSLCSTLLFPKHEALIPDCISRRAKEMQ